MSATLLGVGLLAGVAGFQTLAPKPVPLALDVREPDVALRYRFLPAAGVQSPGFLLEQRLEALAEVAEARRSDKALARLASLDVTGINDDLDALLRELDEVAQVSVHVRDIESRQVLFDYHGDTPLVPASNQKLVTSSAALDLLGADYTFMTRVYRDDDRLYLVGEGDPMLDTDALYSISAAVVPAVELSEIATIVADDSAFSPERFGPGYSREGPGWAYQAPSGALSLNFNTVEVVVKPQRRRRRLLVETDPPCACFEIENEGRRGRRRRISIETFARDGQTVIGVRGTMTRRSRTARVRRRVIDPALYTGGVFADQLAELTSSEPLPVERGRVPQGAELVWEHESPPLIEVVDSGLSYSNNFIAEQVLRTLAWRMTGEPGGWSDGKQVLEDYWLALGGDPDAFIVENASGLTRNGRLTTSGLVDLIAMAYRDAGQRNTLIDALPVAGEPGTMRTRLRRSGKRVRAKTGTLAGVSGLSGVVTSEDGTAQLAFSILINVRQGGSLTARSRRRFEDRIVMRLLSALDAYEAERGGLVAER